MIDILGVRYEIVFSTEQEDERLKGNNGFVDWTSRSIVIDRTERGDLSHKERFLKKVIRHEIVHAFLLECGLDYCTSPCDAWADNEEMVDWFARMGERIVKAWKDADALDKEETPEQKTSNGVIDMRRSK